MHLRELQEANEHVPAKHELSEALAAFDVVSEPARLLAVTVSREQVAVVSGACSVAR